MKKLFLVFSVAVSSFGFGQVDYSDSLILAKCIHAETVEYWMIRYINEERQKYGLDTLILDPTIDKVANNHSTWMAKTGKFEHSTSGLNIAEVITTGGGLHLTHKSEARGAVNRWMASTVGHREALLDPTIKYIGSGFAVKIDYTYYSIGYPITYNTVTLL